MITQVIGIVLIPATNALGGTQKSWIIVAAVLGVIGAICLTVCFKTTKERYGAHVTGVETESTEEKLSTIESLKILAHNKYWWMMMLSQSALSGV